MAYIDDWYVDANNGNDAWDGMTGAIPTQAMIDEGGTIAGPRRTLQAMMSDDCVKAGWVAGGDCNDGGGAETRRLSCLRVSRKPFFFVFPDRVDRISRV